MTEIKQNNFSAMTVDAVIEQLAGAYTAVLRQGLPLKLLPSVMLWGPPGVGKSQAVRQLADRIRRETGKQTVVTDVRLLLFNPIDLRGIPTANEDKTLAVWLKPKIFQMDPSPNVVNLLFLDELSAAPQSVQAAAYQITLDRVVGEHKLPENCIVLAAGNRVTDRSVAFKMPKALANRLLHIEVEPDMAAWRKWAVGKNIHPKVVGFLSFRPNHFMTFDPTKEDLAFATPRSWEMVSNYLTAVNADAQAIYPLIAGLVGSGTAVEFCTWCRIWNRLPRIEDIFDGRGGPAPQGTDVLYALVAAMTDYAARHRTDMTRITNSIVYASKLPPDFSAVLLQNYIYLEPGYKEKLMRIPAFTKWLHEKGRYLNGVQ